jgi:hypothetical protein
MQGFFKVFLSLDKKLHLLLFSKVIFDTYIKALHKNEIILPIYYPFYNIIL